MQARIELKKKVIQPKGDARKDCMETIQKDLEDGAKEIAQTTKLERYRGPKTCADKNCGSRKGCHEKFEAC